MVVTIFNELNVQVMREQKCLKVILRERYCLWDFAWIRQTVPCSSNSNTNERKQ